MSIQLADGQNLKIIKPMTKAEIYDKLENHSCADGYCSTCDYLRMEIDKINLEDQEPMVAWHLAREKNIKHTEDML